jgi:hypothetical protein
MDLKKIWTFAEFVNEGLGSGDMLITEGESANPELVLGLLKAQSQLGENFKKLYPQSADFSKDYGGAPRYMWIPCYRSLDIYNSIPDESKKKQILDELVKKFNEPPNLTEKNFALAVSNIEKLAQDKKKWEPILPELKDHYQGGTFFAIISEEEIETPPSEDKTNPYAEDYVEFDLIEPEKANYFFKDNKYKLEPEVELGETFNDPDYAAQILDRIDSVLQASFSFYNKFKSTTKSIGIESITIRTSCSRYRNLGTASDLSWAELAYNRANSFSNYIGSIANLYANPKEGGEKNEEFLNLVMSKVKIDYLGSNGDGTSGPDPDKNSEGGSARKGYYISSGGKSVFKDKTGKSLLDIEIVQVKTGEGKPPILGSKPAIATAKNLDYKDMTDSDLPKDRKDYDQYRYIYIEIVGSPALNEDPDTLPAEVEKTKSSKVLEYNLKVCDLRPYYGGGGGGGGGFNWGFFKKFKGKKRKKGPSYRQLRKRDKRAKARNFFKCKYSKDDSWKGYEIGR